MRSIILAAAAILVAAPAFAQPYGYGAPPSVHDRHVAHRAERVARERAAIGDYEGARRAHHFAQRKRAESRALRQEGY